MTELEDRLRRDLPALADVLMGIETARPGENAGTMVGGPGIVVEIGAQPAPRRRRWPLVAAAAVVAAAAGVVALVVATSDGTEVLTTDVPVAQPGPADVDRSSEPVSPEPSDEAPEAASDQMEDPTAEPGTPRDQTDIANGQGQDPAEGPDGGPAPPDENPREEGPSDTGAVAEYGVLDGTFSAISAGLYHTCAIATSGNIVCWHQDFVARGVYDPVASTAMLGRAAGPAAAPEGIYRAVAAGWHHSCAIAIDSTITCWGDNSDGKADAPEGTYQAIAAGLHHSCAIAIDSTITCWGDNSDGKADAPEGIYRAVAAGWHHSCAIAIDSTITCWGDNSDGKADAPAGTYQALTAGANHNCALATDRTITCWGSTGFGQADAPAGTYQAVSAGVEHSCAIETGGNVVCWGSNFANQSEAPDGSYQVIAAGGWHNCALAADGTIACWGNDETIPIGEIGNDGADAPSTSDAVSEQPDTPSMPDAVSEQPEVSIGGDDGPARPGEGVTVLAGRGNWTSGYFQAALYRRLLEELGYSVSDPAEIEFGPSNGYTAMAAGEMDYWPNSWYPLHAGWLAQRLPDGSRVADHVTAVGEQLMSGSAQGYLATRSFADEFGVYTLDDLNDDAEALAAYDATDAVPGNGKAEVYGCARTWVCADVIDNQIAFSGWDNIVQVKGEDKEGYDVNFATAAERVTDAVPVVVYTWVPSLYITLLRPGDNVYWMGVDDILDDSNPTGVQDGHAHDQRGLDGTGGFAAFGPLECPSAAEQPDGRCPIGWLTNDILVTANTRFLEANPAARALFEAVELTVLEVSLANKAVETDGIDPDEFAARWMADNRDRVDAWLAAARAAA